MIRHTDPYGVIVTTRRLQTGRRWVATCAACGRTIEKSTYTEARADWFEHYKEASVP
jgi:hypothetical protein